MGEPGNCHSLWVVGLQRPLVGARAEWSATRGTQGDDLRFLTADECTEWCTQRGIRLGSDGHPERYPSGAGELVRFAFPDAPGPLPWLCRFVSECLKPRHECLLWVQGFGIFPSSENLHLYYWLRQSYGDLRLLREGP
jgi:hypothetical protein